MKTAVIVFPGSNCDRDAVCALRLLSDHDPCSVWHGETSLPDRIDLVILPGGFSYGDHLRAGAIAARSAILPAIVAHAHRGGYVMGICNGFHILTETRLLPGALIRNAGLTFICRQQRLVVNRDTDFTRAFDSNETCIPIAHLHGNYRAGPDCLQRLADNGRIAFSYPAGDNPNGSAGNIAGLVSDNGRVLGMMPHPERAVEPLCGGRGGIGVFESVQEALSREVTGGEKPDTSARTASRNSVSAPDRPRPS